MIFVTVGNIEPFDRLVEAVDSWAGLNSSGEEVVAQIGNAVYQPRHCKFVPFLTPTEYRDHYSRARFVVGHAGMGTIISALELQKPIVVMPRLQEKGELRNNHQLATIRHFRKSNLIMVVDSETDLASVMNQAVASTSGADAAACSGMGENDWPPDPQLIAFVRDFIMKS